VEERRFGGAAVDVGAVLEKGSVRAEYQPIVSVKGRRIVGFEALARATDPSTGRSIGPEELFAEAARRGLTLELDRLCRRRAIEGFVGSVAVKSDLALFMNIDTSLIDAHTAGSNHIRDLAAAYGLEPGRIVIELLESEISDLAALGDFVRRYHEYGFVVALDDLGSGYSNLERIVSLKPEIIKIDRALVSGIEDEFYKQELLDFLIKLTSKLGVLAIAEGVETKEAGVACLSRGADIVQGFYFGRPGHIEDAACERCLQRAEDALEEHKSLERRRIPERRKLYRGYDGLTSRICGELSRCPPETYDQVISEAIAWFVEVECAYVLDSRGTQVSSTVFNPARSRRKASTLFSPSEEGDDLSAKDYFLFLDRASDRYVTTPYISRASGAVCMTISAKTKNAEGLPIVLCLDIDIKGAS